MPQPITLTPIGVVRSKFSQNTPPETMRAETSQIVIEPELEAGLLGLSPGTDIQVFFYLHRIADEQIELQLHPRHNPENPLAGVFATRTQFRPSRIGATVARVEAIDGNVLTVSGLDAQDGSPVVDVKPYARYFDADTRSQQFEARSVDSLQAVRAAIDAIDAEVIWLLGQRARYVRQAAEFKDKPEDAPAPARYRQVMQRRREMAVEAGLDPDVIEEMYRVLVDYFIRQEETLIRARGGTD